MAALSESRDEFGGLAVDAPDEFGGVPVAATAAADEFGGIPLDEPPAGPDEFGIGQEVRGVGRALKRGVRSLDRNLSALNLDALQGARERLPRLQSELTDLEARLAATPPNTEQSDILRRAVDNQRVRVAQLERVELPQREAAAPGQVANVARQTKAIAAIPGSPDLKNLRTDFWKTFLSNPVETIATVTAESVPQMLPGMAAGTLAGGPVGTAVGAGANSFAVEYASTLLSSAEEQGYDLTNQDQVEAFLKNPQALGFARRKATQRGVPVAAFDAATAGIAGRLLKPALGQGVGPVARGTAQELGVQMAGGMAGETAGQLASEGKITSVPDIVLEGVAELGSAPAEVFSNIRGEQRTAKAKAEPQAVATKAAELKPKTGERPTSLDELAADPEAAAVELSPEEIRDLEAAIRGNQLTETPIPTPAEAPTTKEEVSADEGQKEEGRQTLLNEPVVRESRTTEDQFPIPEQAPEAPIAAVAQPNENATLAARVAEPATKMGPEAQPSASTPAAPGMGTNSFDAGALVVSEQYGRGTVKRDMGKRVLVQFDTGKPFAVAKGSLKMEPQALDSSRPVTSATKEDVTSPQDAREVQRLFDEGFQEKALELYLSLPGTDQTMTIGHFADVMRKARSTTLRNKEAFRGAQLRTESADPIERALTRAIDATKLDPSKMSAYVLPTWIPQAAANGALKAMLAAYKGGKKIKAAVEDGLFWLSKNYPALMPREKELRAEMLKLLKDTNPTDAQAYRMGPTRRVWAERLLGKEGPLPKLWKPILEQQTNNRQTIEEAVKVRVKDVESQLAREYPKPADAAAAKERLLAFWSGGEDVTVGSPELNKRAAAVRNYIDTLTTIAVKGGMFSAQRGEKILGNLGSWLRRSYAAFDSALRWNYDELQKRYTKGDPEVKRIWDAAEKYLQAQNPEATPDEITTTLKTLVNRAEMETLMDGILAGSGPSASNRAGIDISSLIRRKDIPVEIREWMGEIKDPFYKALTSGKWMAQFMARHETQKRMAALGLKHNLFTKKQDSIHTEQIYPNDMRLAPALDEEGKPLPRTDDGKIPAEYRSEIDERYNPLHGLWTTPELKAALETYETRATEGATMIDAAKNGYLWALGLAKSNLVGNNPFAWPANIMGGFMMNLANGYVNPYRYKRAWDAVRNGADSIDAVATKKALAARANYLMAVKSGVLDAGLFASDLRATLGDQFSVPESWAEAKEKFQNAAAVLRSSGGTEGKAELAKALYGFTSLPAHYMMTTPDNVFRVNAFLSELETAKKAFPAMSQNEQIKWAGERASNTYQTYSRLPAGVRALSRLPLLGTFVQFKLELIRNTFHTIRYAIQDMRSSNPALKRSGAERLMALFGIVGGAVALASAGGDDDRKKQALQEDFVPPWDRNEVIAVVDREGTKWKYASLSYIVPHIELVKLYNAAERVATKPDTEAKQVIDGLMDDFLGPGVVLGPLVEAGMNRRIGSDGKITLRNDVSGVAKRLNHAVQNFIPGSKYGQVFGDLWKGAQGETGDYGKTYDVEDTAKKLLGLRVRGLDVAQTLGYRMSALTHEWRDASANANLSKRRDIGKADALAEEATYTRETQADLRKRYQRLIANARILGVPESVIREKEKDFAVPAGMK